MDPDVELLIASLEKTFGVELGRYGISDETTVEELEQFVVASLPTATSHRCWSSVVFWRFRAALIEISLLPRSTVKPWAFLEDVIPQRRRRSIWKSVSKKLDLRLPCLEYPGWLQPTAFAIGFTLLWGMLTARGWWCVLLGLGAPLIMAALLKLATPLATDFPTNAQTVRDVVRTVAGLNYATLESQLGAPHEREVREGIKLVIMELTGAHYLWLAANVNLLDLLTATRGFR